MYDSYGNITIYDKDGDEITAESATYLKNPYTFTGREYDPESGDYYYRNRYYNPQTSRFLSEDPIGFAGLDTNLYRYVENDPVNYVDPVGLWTFGIGFGGGFSFGGGNLSGDFQLVFDDKGNIGLSRTICLGGVTEAAGANLGVVGSLGSGNTIRDLSGGSTVIGAIFGSGTGGGGVVSISDPLETLCGEGVRRRAITGTGFYGITAGYSPVDLGVSRCSTGYYFVKLIKDMTLLSFPILALIIIWLAGLFNLIIASFFSFYKIGKPIIKKKPELVTFKILKLFYEVHIGFSVLFYGGEIERFAREIGLGSAIKLGRTLYVPIPFFIIAFLVLFYGLVGKVSMAEISFIILLVGTILSTVFTVYGIVMPIIKEKPELGRFEQWYGGLNQLGVGLIVLCYPGSEIEKFAKGMGLGFRIKIARTFFGFWIFFFVVLWGIGIFYMN